LTNTPFLQKALQNDPRFYEIIKANELNETYLEQLFSELFSSSCEGIETKVAETRSGLLGFKSLLSELEFARYFTSKKLKVRLLSCNDFGQRDPPDIWVHNGSKEYWVEVKNIQDDETTQFIAKGIAKILNAQNLAFAVSVTSSPSLSIPTYFFDTRREKENLVQPILDEFKEKLDVCARSPPITITTSSAVVQLYKTKFKESYFATATAGSTEPSDYGKRIKTDVLYKAEKRTKWSGEELEKPYIVAIDDESWFFDSIRYNVVLFGNATTNYPRVLETNVDREIQEAANKGWREYLKRMHIIEAPIGQIPDDKRGLFFTDTITKNISAVLVTSQQKFYIFANPLTDDRINDPAILEDFEDCISGWGD
jgi:hypothetical protein